MKLHFPYLETTPKTFSLAFSLSRNNAKNSAKTILTTAVAKQINGKICVVCIKFTDKKHIFAYISGKSQQTPAGKFLAFLGAKKIKQSCTPSVIFFV